MDFIDGTDRAKRHVRILRDILARGHFKHVLDERAFTAEERDKIKTHIDAVSRVLDEGDPMTFLEILQAAKASDGAIACAR